MMKKSKLKELVFENLIKEYSAKTSTDPVQQQRNIQFFRAARVLKMEAQRAALDFEDQIVKQMGLQDPDQMDGTSQRVYHQVTERMHTEVAAAVMKAINGLGSLPKAATKETKP